MESLTFNTSRIKIVQFTDLHFGEAAEQDELSLSLMRSVLSAERPDFVVFSGDLVSGYAILSEERRRFRWQRVLGVSDVPFATLFGNHDDQPYCLDPLLWRSMLLYCTLAIAIAAAVLAYAFNAKRKMVIVLIYLLSTCIIALVAAAPSNSVRLSLLLCTRCTLFPRS